MVYVEASPGLSHADGAGVLGHGTGQGVVFGAASGSRKRRMGGGEQPGVPEASPRLSRRSSPSSTATLSREAGSQLWALVTCEGAAEFMVCVGLWRGLGQGLAGIRAGVRAGLQLGSGPGSGPGFRARVRTGVQGRSSGPGSGPGFRARVHLGSGPGSGPGFRTRVRAGVQGQGQGRGFRAGWAHRRP